MPSPMLFMFTPQAVRRASSLAFDNDGTRIDTNSAMTAITTSSSISVKPRRMFMVSAPAEETIGCLNHRTYYTRHRRHRGMGSLGLCGRGQSNVGEVDSNRRAASM